MSKGDDDRRIALMDAGRFTDLFVEELGWEHPKARERAIEVDGHSFSLIPVAEYRGVRVWCCNAVPDRSTQRLIDADIKKESAERLLIFFDGTQQHWKWPLSSDSQGRGSSRIVTHEHFVGNRTESLLQRLQQIEIGLEEEPSVVEVVSRLRRAFDADAVTKSFYSRFSDEHKALASLVKGIRTEADRDWYAALLLNRLMFIYFLQRKGFMNSDIDYLRNRLSRVKQVAGTNKFYEFYSDFLLPLFHDGLGSPARPVGNAALAALIGDIPYVNGGIFSTHALEATHKINIPDKAFESIFDLFDKYRWHLDDRPTGQPNEINPDVLGYIFEQFINNKEQGSDNKDKGAYYTKEDVTYFMASSTVLPEFIERLAAETKINPWLRLTTNPDRYIWQSLSYAAGEPLPEDVASQAKGFPRPSWNSVAPDTHGLPGETWWEVAARRDRYHELSAALKRGDVANADSAVTQNIDMETLAIDVIDHLDTPADVVAAWKVLSDLKIIDPTCGSGAFLFAALKILEILYMVVLEAAERHSATTTDPALHALLQNADRHPSRQYFCLKHAAIKNLYGVDIMNEAVEIARLRLFLKLVSAVHQREDLEPLPDLDFNIKPGNILVGADSVESIAISSNNLFGEVRLDDVIAAGREIAAEYAEFQYATESGDDKVIAQKKSRLLSVLESVRDTVDRQYHESQSASTLSYEKWRASHKPFHWFVEFPEVFSQGGFDVVIGNPPYVSKRKVTTYQYKGFKTDDLPDIYAPCVERASSIVNAVGRFAMILPISSQFGADFVVLRRQLEETFDGLWVSAFSRNPAALFSAGLGVRSTIIVGAKGASVTTRHFTKTHRWYDAYRPALFETLSYVDLSGKTAGAQWLRPTSSSMATLLEGCLNRSASVANAIRTHGAVALGFKQTSLYYLSVFREDPPAFELDCEPTPQTQIGRLSCANEKEANIVLAVLLSKFAFVWWYASGDDFHVTQDGLRNTPIDPLSLSSAAQDRLAEIAIDIRKRQTKHLMFTKYAGKWMGNYVISEIRYLTDEVDAILARELGYEDCLPALEHAYYSVFKPTGERPGTLRESPCASKG